MKNLEKLDVLMIIFVIIVCLFALVVMYGWPQGTWVMSWSALGAIFTAIAAIGSISAVFVAIKAPEKLYEKEKKISNEKEAQDLKAALDILEIAVRPVMESTNNTAMFVNQLVRVGGGAQNSKLDLIKTCNKRAKVIQNAYEELISIDWSRYPLSLLAPTVLSIKNDLTFFIDEVKSLPFDIFSLNRMNRLADRMNHDIHAIRVIVQDKTGYVSGWEYSNKIKPKRWKKAPKKTDGLSV